MEVGFTNPTASINKRTVGVYVSFFFSTAHFNRNLKINQLRFSLSNPVQAIKEQLLESFYSK